MNTLPSPESDGKERRLFSIVSLAAAVFYLVFIFRNSFLIGKERFFNLFDDAMISMTYARNLAQGHGLIWNIHQPPVEGYTNFLWTLIMAGIHLLPLPDSKTSLAVSLLGSVILIANLLMVRRVTREMGLAAPTGIIATILTAFYFPLVYWTLRGMEVGLIALLISSAVLLALKLSRQFDWLRFLGLAFILGAGILTRTDALIPGVAVTALLLIPLFQQRQWLPMILLPAALAGVLACHTAWRIHYYGDALPNTYYLKVEGVSPWERYDRGVKCLLLLGAFHLWPLLVVVGCGVAGRVEGLFSRPALFLWGIFLSQVAYSVYVGGDAWEWMYFSNRYISVAMPLLFILVAIAIPGLARLSSVRLSLALGGALPLGFLAQALYFAHLHKWPAVATMSAAFAAVVAVYLWLSRDGKNLPLQRPLVTTVLVLVIVNFFGLSSWGAGKTNNGKLIAEDQDMTRMALRVRDLTTPDATIAVVWAGALPYFSHRDPIDLLGKSDRFIARGKPQVSFYPGHNKWNYAYSLDVEKPDLVLQLWSPKPADFLVLQRDGYVSVPGTTWYVRSSRIHVLKGS